MAFQQNLNEKFSCVIRNMNFLCYYRVILHGSQSMNSLRFNISFQLFCYWFKEAIAFIDFLLDFLERNTNHLKVYTWCARLCGNSIEMQTLVGFNVRTVVLCFIWKGFRPICVVKSYQFHGSGTKRLPQIRVHEYIWPKWSLRSINNNHSNNVTNYSHYGLWLFKFNLHTKTLLSMESICCYTHGATTLSGATSYKIIFHKTGDKTIRILFNSSFFALMNEP